VSEFPLVKLSELAEISGGITKNSKRSALPIQRPYLSVANVYANRLDLEKVGTIGINEGELGRAELKDGDLLVVEGNGSLSQLGRVAQWRDEIKGCVHQNHLIKVRPGEEVESKWILYWLMSPAGRRAIEAVGSSTSGLHTLSLSKVSSLPTPLAPKEIQYKAIAYIELHLSRLDETVATLKAIKAKLKQARASILKAAVEGRLVETDTPWSTRPLRELLSEPMRNGKSAKTSASGQGVRIATLTAVTANQFTESNTKPADLDPLELDDLWLQPEDIFVQRSNAPELVGTSAMYSGQPNWAIFPDLLIRVRCSPEILPKWMLANLQAPSTRRYFKENAKGSSGSMPKISQSVIAEAMIACPSLKDQKASLEELERRFSVLDQVEATVNASLRRCGQLRQAVLKMAFGG
jgi:type I restriction enzyme S subunit